MKEELPLLKEATMEYFPCLGEDCKAKSSQPVTLLLPALSIGNVGQLATDLIIASWQSQKVGYLDDPHILPCVGNDPFEDLNKGELSVALEVYEAYDDLRIIQQRSPVIKGTMLKFAKNLAAWATTSNTREVIILSSLDSGKRPMQDVGSSPLRYISTANPDGTDERCEGLGWRKLEQFQPLTKEWKLLETYSCDEAEEDVESHEISVTDEMYYPSLPFASLFSCCKAKGLNALCILLFCAEGDNIQDAFLLAEALESFRSRTRSSGEVPVQWSVPFSWRSVYGPPPDPAMFY